MQARKAAMVGVVLAVLIAAGAVAWWILFGSVNGTYYTQIDNGRTEELQPTGGVIDPTGGMSLRYTLPAYDEQGDEREISFGTERQLRESAYLKLEVVPIRGVVGWEEVQFDELPQKVQEQMEGSTLSAGL